MDCLARAQADLASQPCQNSYHYLRASWSVSWGMALGSMCPQHPTATERRRGRRFLRYLAPGGED